MIKARLAGILVFGLAALSACDKNPLKDYVEQDVELKVSKGADGILANGQVNFTAISYYTAYRNVCDTYECGGYEQVCTPGRQVCAPVKRCTPSGCTEDTVCKTEGGGCTSEYVSRTCERNCREEPYTAENDVKVPSNINVKIEGVSDPKAIQGLYLGVKPNQKFEAAFDDVSQRAKGYEYLWNEISKDAKTLLIAAAKGYKLSANQSFLDLPSGFKPGDAVNVTVELESDSSGAAKNGVSATGTAVDFPALSYSN